MPNERPPFFPQSYWIKNEDVLIMDHCLHNSLDVFMTKFSGVLSLHTKLYILYLIALALRELQNIGIVHMDIKPQNILVNVLVIKDYQILGSKNYWFRRGHPLQGKE